MIWLFDIGGSIFIMFSGDCGWRYKVGCVYRVFVVDSNDVVIRWGIGGGSFFSGGFR